MSDEVINAGQLEIRYLVDGSASGGLGVFELTVPPGANVPPPHSHRDNEEFFYVVEGSITYSVDADTRELKPGEWMSTPRGSVHGFRNGGSQPARALVVLTPDIGAQYFRDVATVINAGGPPDKARLVEVMSRYGLTLAAPSRAGASGGV
ncbi:cupin domain-containing protein [Variovorax sp. Sphag1AA]|uniref:cupin domain-containing protein n=1 Tax=Variovorax sp. Sphag1AA TaxID=2587027 RepID=UPI00161501E4|nr:cupin domain-containing protein [Variovorax sp. Sphag1AA]MBB3177856.1 quercetin dioxygenase-like cupin family protein [Variovorax sp. Sphag1AA]